MAAIDEAIEDALRDCADGHITRSKAHERIRSAIAAALDGLRPDLPTTGPFPQKPDHMLGRGSMLREARRALLGTEGSPDGSD